MNICMICPCMGNLDESPLIGGHENNVVRLSKGLYNRNHRIIIITTPSIHSRGNKDRIINLDWGTVYSLSVAGPYGSMQYGLDYIRKSAKIIKRLRNQEHFDLVFGHSGYPILGLLTGTVGKLLSLPSVHALYCPLQGEATDFFARMYLPHIDYIISLSTNTKDSLINIGIPTERIGILPPALELQKASSIPTGGAKNACESADASPTALYLGDLSETRGLPVLLNAVHHVAQEYPEFRLLLAVNIPLERYMREPLAIKETIQSLKLTDNVVPIGIVKDIFKVMESSDMFIAPYSDIESIADYPVSILEAMAVGTPIIASSVGGIPEFIKHRQNGILVTPGSSSELADAIRYLIENPDTAERMGGEGTKTVQERFGLDTIACGLEEILEEVVSNYHRNRGT